MNKALSQIVSFFVYMSIWAGSSMAHASDMNTIVKGRPIAINVLENVAYNTDISIIWDTAVPAYSGGKIDTVKSKVKTEPQFDVEGDVIYVMDSQQTLSAMHIETHEIIWQKKISIKKTVLPPFMKVINGIVVIGKDKNIYGLDSNTGKQRWHKILAHSVNSPITGWRQSAIFQTDGYRTLALKVKTGALLWQHSVSNNEMSFAETPKVIAVDNIGYVVYPTGDVSAIKLNTGQVLWDKELNGQAYGLDDFSFVGGGGSGYTLNPVSIGDMLYVASNDSELSAIKRKTGTLQWFKNISSTTNMIAVGKVLYVMGTDSVLRAINSQNGSLFWSVDVSKLVNKYNVNPTYMHYYKGKVILFTKSGKIALLSIDTAQLIAIHSTVSIITNPVNAAGKLIVMDKNEKLKAYK